MVRWPAALAGGTEAGETYAPLARRAVGLHAHCDRCHLQDRETRLERSGGGRGKARCESKRAVPPPPRARAKGGGWSCRSCQPRFNVFEKELRYAVRNAQLRTMAAMPIIMTLVIQVDRSRRGGIGGGGDSSRHLRPTSKARARP